VAPTGDKVLHPPGQWNSARVVAIGDKIEHYLNGKLVAAAESTGPAWETTVALSKFSGSSDFGRGRSGDRIMLTDHGGRVRYRKFHFVARSAEPTEPVARRGPFLGNGSRNSWATQDSIVLWTRTTQRPELLADGKPFVTLSLSEANQLARQEAPAEMLSAQLPKGAKLDEMFGACPGAPGRVRLSYYPVGKRHTIKHADWRTTEQTATSPPSGNLKAFRRTLVMERSSRHRRLMVSRPLWRWVAFGQHPGENSQNRSGFV
jgi:hypothetical protein